jgi:hypothetical protein
MAQARWRTLAGILAGMLAGGSLMAVAWAHGGGDSLVHSCVNRWTGIVRIVSPNAACRSWERALVWGMQGPQGLQGDPGPSRVEKVTKLKTGAQDNFTPTDLDFHERLTLGTFTKDSSSSRVRITWEGPAWIEGTEDGICTFQLRVDGAKEDGSTSPAIGGEAGNAVLWLTNGARVNEAAINDMVFFDGLSAGSHVITVWVRGFAPDTCFINPGVFGMTTYVEELP